MTPRTIKRHALKGKIALPGGWYLVRDDDKESPHYLDWFLSSPDETAILGEGIWVAKFWDGPASGEYDATSFALAIYAAMRAA